GATGTAGVKVTVVVPTYNSGPHIEPLVASLLAQSLPPDAFEVLFVDDGSTDATPARLAALAAAHRHFRTVRIPNSGWPGRPRNVGVAQARGAYVQFVDHDDRLAPEALERLYAMAERNGSDIVIGKVASNFRARGVPNALISRTRESCTLWNAPLIDSLTPHKMFRTAFLREHGIVHPEGPWILEDQLFMVRAYLKASVVSVLGEYVCYAYWAREDTANAGTSAVDPRAFYGNLREILATVVAGTEPGPARDRLLRRFYRVELLHRLGVPPTGMPSDPPFLADPFEAVREVAEEFMTEGAYAGLPVLHRVRAALLRAGRPAELTEFTRRQAELRALCAVDATHWRRGRLRVEFTARFEEHPGGPGLLLARRGTRYFLAPALTDGVTPEPVEVTEALRTFTADVLLRHTDSAHVWPVERTTALTLEEVPGEVPGTAPDTAPGAPPDDGTDTDTVLVRPVVRGTATVDPSRTAGGRPLDDGVWEVRIRLTGAGFDRHAPALTPEGAPLTVRRTDVPPPDPATPKVSVVVRTGGARPGAVAETLASLTRQTLPASEFEAVEAPDRDTGLASATGAYVLFLEPGTRLAPEALARMYAYGMEHDADIVAGKPAAQGRPVPRELFVRDRPRATLARDPLADSLGADKLFDRAFLTAHGLRFGDGTACGARAGGREALAEQAFTAEATLRAGRTAVLGSYVCCHYPPDDGPPPLPALFYPALRALMARVDALTGPGPVRDRLHRRWLRLEILDRLTGRALLDLTSADRGALFTAARAVVRNGVSPTAVPGLPAVRRVAVGLIADGRQDDLVTLAHWETSLRCRPRLDALTRGPDGGLGLAFTARLEADTGPLGVTGPGPGCPDGPALAPTGVPEALKDRFAREALTGAAHPGRASAVLVLRAREGGTEHLLPTETTVPASGSTTALTLSGTAALPAPAGLADGVWDVSVRLTALGWTRTARLGGHRAATVALPPSRAAGITPYWTTPSGDLSLRVTTPPPGPRRALLGRVRRAVRRLRRSAGRKP
ncbi:glycosyltransferase family A protein, partial [Streptomyces sp. NPDC093085]|uniref:glycosyltransferase family A protein n=1 Tax=Streptomyces sp. NPDC093085 TaxID=3155068 RepID=UPI00341FE038